MNIFNICCPCLTSPPEEYAAVDDTTGIGVATVSVGASPDEEMQTNEPSTSGGATGTTPVVTTQPAAEVVPVIVAQPAAEVTPVVTEQPAADVKLPKPLVIYKIATEGTKSSEDKKEKADYITQKLKDILTISSAESTKLKNSIVNSGYEEAPERACQHLAGIFLTSTNQSENVDDDIKKFLVTCDCQEQNNGEHEALNHNLESLLEAHSKMDLAREEINDFCVKEKDSLSEDTFLMMLSDCSEYYFEKALECIKNYKIDPHTERRLKVILMFSLVNEVYFRLTHTDKQVSSEAIKNGALNTINKTIAGFIAKHSYDLKKIVTMIICDIVQHLTLPVNNTEEIFQIMKVKITDTYLSNLLIKK